MEKSGYLHSSGGRRLSLSSQGGQLVPQRTAAAQVNHLKNRLGCNVETFLLNIRSQTGFKMLYDI